jgi:hypothetical protein
LEPHELALSARAQPGLAEATAKNSRRPMARPRSSGLEREMRWNERPPDLSAAAHRSAMPHYEARAKPVAGPQACPRL